MKPEPKKNWQHKIKGTATTLGQSFKRKKITHLHKLFRNKGTGFYGVGYVFTLLFLEANSLIDEVADFTFSLDNLIGDLITHIISFSIETLVNIIKASIWPAILLSELPQPFGVSLLAVAFLAYYMTDKKWGFHSIYKNKFSENNALSVIELWQQQQPNNFDTLRHLQIPAVNSIKWLLDLITQAKARRLENWRYHPDSCFALVVLLNAKVADNLETEQNQSKTYCLEIIEGAVEHKLHQELDRQQRYYFYSPLSLSSLPKHQKLYSKLYKKLSKSK